MKTAMAATIQPLRICGNGGHAASVAAACAAAGIPSTRLDDATWAQEIQIPSLAPYICGIGNKAGRKDLYIQLKNTGVQLETVVHPSACVDSTATVREGAFVGAFAYIGPGACVGPGAIINTRAVVEHGAIVEEGAHVSVGATLCGGAILGSFADLFAHALLLPGVRVGHDAVVGAGAVVTRDVRPMDTVIGLPARPVTFEPDAE